MERRKIPDWENKNIGAKHTGWGEAIGGQKYQCEQPDYHQAKNKVHTPIAEQEYRRNKQQDSMRKPRTCLEKESLSPKYSCPDLHGQFELFSKFGQSGSSGTKIKLSQSDRWLRQARVIDGWNVTTIDAAIAFRKISKGTIWLEFKL